MQAALIKVTGEIIKDDGPERVLSFGPFVRYLERRCLEATGHKQKYFSYVITELKKTPELIDGLPLEEVSKYESQLQLVYNTLSPMIADENEQYWGLNFIGSPTIFYATNGFLNLITDLKTGELRKAAISHATADIKKGQRKRNYAIILEKCFQVNDLFPNEMVYSMMDEQSGLPRYFRLELDTRFIEVRVAKPLPELNIATMRANYPDADAFLEVLETLLPPEQFRFEGFGITNITEVTATVALNNIRNLVLNDTSFDGKDFHREVIRALKTLAGKPDIDFGLLPVIKVNDRLIFNNTSCVNSKLMRTADGLGVAERTYLSLADDYLKNPQPLLFNDIQSKASEGNPYLKMLRVSGIESYALKPVFFNNSLAGVLEIYSTKKGSLNDALLSRLDPAISLLAQLLQHSIDEFSHSVEKIIKEKFTAVQPSVQWKFNEAALQYLRESKARSKPPEIGEVIFERVHPLYGAIDIRNSTVERNEALHKDLLTQFNLLLTLLETLKKQSGFGLLDEKIFQCRQWMKVLSSSESPEQESGVTDFLEEEITPFLLQFVESNQEYSPLMQDYFDAINERTGIVYENRRQLESSMSVVISLVNDHLDKIRNEGQQAYPFYFEKFRTDGVEYDIYIGQSIAPDKPFNEIYLKNLRLLQLSSMAAIAKQAHELQPQLARPVETTQLIFIHAHPIDIRFRRDEKRFDVEGSYNIRYQIVKKRIDKVLIKGTSQRLTQPGKIAMVYFNQREADEYVSYVRFLQQEKILNEDLEYLELEELQGVAGLRAMRVGVGLTVNG
ncbi:MAG TPA: hypothetical protein VG890_17895 [Puia sp.]|nr:hypothetical protein [Puia sp.]